MIVYQICAYTIDSIDRGHFNTREEIDLTKLPPLIDVSPCREGEIPIFVNTASSDEYVERRSIQRKTWIAEAKQINSSLRIIFVMAKPKEMSGKYQEQVELESKLNEDILQFDFIDTYYNLTLKHLSWMYWCIKNCKTTTYVIKTDDDVILNVQRLETKLEYNSFGYGISGKLFKSSPIRDRNDKWFMPEEVYPEEYYPPYLCGAFYVLTRVLLDQLYEVAINQNEYPVIVYEDVYITGIAAQLANIPRNDTYEYLTMSTDLFYSVACYLFYISAYGGFEDISMKDVYLTWKTLDEKRDCIDPIRNEIIAIIALLLIIICAIICRFRQIRSLFRRCFMHLNTFIRFTFLALYSFFKTNQY
jgi:hypothetical protein